MVPILWAQSVGKGEALEYDLISVDDHVIEPPNVWVDRLPHKFRDSGPHVIEAEGREYWVYEGRRATTMGLNAVAGKDRKEFSMDPVRYSDMIPVATTRCSAREI